MPRCCRPLVNDWTSFSIASSRAESRMMPCESAAPVSASRKACASAPCFHSGSSSKIEYSAEGPSEGSLTSRKISLVEHASLVFDFKTPLTFDQVSQKLRSFEDLLLILTNSTYTPPTVNVAVKKRRKCVLEPMVLFSTEKYIGSASSSRMHD
jgi:hypothetical protein